MMFYDVLLVWTGLKTRAVLVIEHIIFKLVVVVTLFIQGGPFSYEAGIQRGPIYIDGDWWNNAVMLSSSRHF